MVNAILSFWTWFEIGACALCGFLAQLPLLVTLPFDPRRWYLGRSLRRAAIVGAKLTPYWDFAVEGPAPRRLPSAMVVVSNHESNADPFLLSHLPWEMKWLSKASLFKVPVFGWAMSLAGDVPLHRGDSSSGRGAMERCKVWLSKGMSVMIFPEGTRSKTEELLPFKDGAFRLAIEQGVDILPLAVSGTARALPKFSWRFGFSRARVMVGEPVSTKGLTAEDVPALRDRVRQIISDMRAQLQPLTRSEAAPRT